MRVLKRRCLIGHDIILKFSKQEIAALRRAETIAEKAREIAERYENGGEGSFLDDELGRAEHGPGGLADMIEENKGALSLQYVDPGSPVFVFKEG